ncbi:Uncharacterized protein FWK35_00006252 [Aphis craccivora]|uniref:Transposable element P transposase-like RNase H C-terminal domain-containing protein n=1 Tax=Aphis craccivora TaxID=307492 RepID=A0A6G0YZM3_APHCR|nr:Uncharacterized protein FWK35_00006252 [Aphis craccivora]
MDLHNALELFKLLKTNGHIHFIITYKLSQDHLETFFSAIRGKGGYNNNPTCRQFQAAYKRLLVHNAIVGSVNGNCQILDSTNTLSVIKKKHYRKDIFQNIESLPENKILDHVYFGNINNINGYIEDVSVYIAGFIAMKI